MQKIVAQFAPNQEDVPRGMEDVICPMCESTLRETDIEHFDETGGDRSVEICTRCREDFEQDNHTEINSDSLPPQLFANLWQAVADTVQARTEAGLTERTAGLIAHALGGRSWQSGGGTWLVLLNSRHNNHLIAISEDVICAYADQKALERNDPLQAIQL